MKKLLVCTFSGGRTSAFMGKFLLEYPKYKDFDKVFIFMNTGKEREETLEFIDRCDREWSLGVVWLESITYPEVGKGVGYKIVDFKTANRTGKPFEDLIKHYKIPNAFESICTRDLKQRPMNKYIKSLGYDDVYVAMGIRNDEKHRMSENSEYGRIIYPLIDDILVDNRFVREWWDKQPFDLQLKDYQGNCDLCFKKSLNKRLTIAKEDPKLAEWWLKMEQKYGDIDHPRFDMRSGTPMEQLIELSKRPFTKAIDLHELTKLQCDLFDYETDCFCKAS